VFALFRDGLLVSRGWNQPSGCVPFSISSPAATTAATPPTEVSFLHRPCFVDREVTSADFFAIESRDCLLGSGVIRHLHEAETLRAPGIAIRDDLNGFNLADLAEHVTEVSFGDLKREISNEDFLCHPISIPVDLLFSVGGYYFRSSRGSRRTFFRLRFRANACLMRFFSPGFK